jgi:hypothetical protein
LIRKVKVNEALFNIICQNPFLVFSESGPCGSGSWNFFCCPVPGGLEGFWSRQATDRMRIAGRLISHELGETAGDEWPGVLTRYSEIYQIDFALILNPEHILLSKEIPFLPR